VDAATREGITWVLGTLLTVSVLVGMAVRFILLPWLRDHLAVPVDEVRRQVSENHHKHTPPTLPDRIETVSADVKTLTRVLEGHLASGDEWLEHITGSLSSLKERLAALEGRVGSMLMRHRADGDAREAGRSSAPPDARAAGLAPPLGPPADVDDATPAAAPMSHDPADSPGKEF
jgi:hypothetical protein